MIYARLRICFEITKIVTRMERDELHSPSRQIKNLIHYETHATAVAQRISMFVEMLSIKKPVFTHCQLGSER